MLLSVAYAIVCMLLDRLIVRAPSAWAQTIELLARRHEAQVLRRQVRRANWQPGDRLLLTALSRHLPRTEWWRFPVRPETLLRLRMARPPRYRVSNRQCRELSPSSYLERGVLAHSAPSFLGRRLPKAPFRPCVRGAFALP